MGVEVRRLTRAGAFLDFERVLDEVVTETKAEIDAAIDLNLSGGMINKTSPERWYVGQVVGGPRSRRLEYTVDPDGLEVPKILHRGVPHSWKISGNPYLAFDWTLPTKVVKQSSKKTPDSPEHVVIKGSVTHPPMPPIPFVEEPVRRIARRIPDRVRSRIRREFRRAG